MLAARAAARCTRAAIQRRSSSSMRVDEVYDLIVIGGGVMGSWTAIAAHKKALLSSSPDQYTPAHENGSSHGDGRIYRLAYTEDIYVDMMERSLPRWRELQDFAGEPLLHQTGGLNIAEKDNPDPQYRLDELGDLYARRGITHEWLSAGEVNERYPQYKLDETLHALWQPDYGVLLASKCVMAAWGMQNTSASLREPASRSRTCARMTRRALSSRREMAPCCVESDRARPWPVADALRVLMAGLPHTNDRIRRDRVLLRAKEGRTRSLVQVDAGLHPRA